MSPTPVPNSTTPFWRTELHELDSHRTTPDLPSDCDIVIIGAGFAGAALAYYLYDDNPSPPSVVILEAREACSGATGRNGMFALHQLQFILTNELAGGHMKPDVYYQVPKYIKKYGVKAAVDVARFEASQVQAFKALVEKEKIDCDFVLTRACDATLDPDLARDTHHAFTELQKSGVANLKDVFYAYGKDAEQTHTPVTRISDTELPDGRWLVETERGSIKAKKILLATNGYTAHLAPQFRDKIVPVRGICSRITVPKDRPVPFLPYTYSIRHGVGMYDYLIPRPDGSIIVGGAKPKFWHDRSQWYNVTDDSKLIEPAVPHFDGLMQRTFKGWETSGAKTDRVWTGSKSSASTPLCAQINHQTSHGLDLRLHAVRRRYPWKTKSNDSGWLLGAWNAINPSLRQSNCADDKKRVEVRGDWYPGDIPRHRGTA
ncbi:hypothetical protein EIK77_006748 [Talaromyces pinophilus]|nr:hypothetical protein EIK77_006748 [Talaromyces pinophilus]